MQQHQQGQQRQRQRCHVQQRALPLLLLVAVAAAAAATVASAFILPATRGGTSASTSTGTQAGMAGRRTASALFGKKRRREQDWCVGGSDRSDHGYGRLVSPN